MFIFILQNVASFTCNFLSLRLNYLLLVSLECSRMFRSKSKTFVNEGDENLVLTWDFQQTKYFIKTMEAGGKLNS